MDVAGFESREYLGFVICDLGQSETIQLAGALAPSLRKVLDGATGIENPASPALLVGCSA
jgi:hypothetical protein